MKFKEIRDFPSI